MKYFFRLFIFLGAGLFFHTAAAQYHNTPYAGKKDSYIPYNPDYWPVKRVRMVLHVFARDDGSGSFANTPADKEFIGRIINHLGYFYTEAEPLKIHDKERNVQLIKDSRIRFVVDTILFHNNTDDWDFSKYTLDYPAGAKKAELNTSAAHDRAEKLYQKYVVHNDALNDREKDSSVNVFLLELGELINRGMASDLGSERWLYILGAYYNYTQAADKPNHWAPGMTLAHELGHCFGLDHPFDYQQCNDLPRSDRGTTNDVMDYWPNQGRAITPCQLGIIHYNLSGHAGVAKAVIPDWNEYHPDEEINIRGADTVYWDGNRNVLGDITVSAGTVWVVRCRVGFPPGARLYIKPNARVVLDGGALVSAYAAGGKWLGVKLESKKKFLLFGRRSNGRIIVQNKGLVE